MVEIPGTRTSPPSFEKLLPISLTHGERLTSQIIDELRSSEWVCLLASKNALASPIVQLEVGGAIFGKKKIVPIMWDVQPSELPRWVSDFQGLILKDRHWKTSTFRSRSLQQASNKAKTMGSS
jgi:hypothetical protein